ncbi:protein of unknown function [Paracoccus halophilus]|uniref:DUF1850 domain-containing protein n=1 Tax=Paracoccus halophilus TaxID=376733 RepID=A0A099F219_9RHOB|nr:DUF1850 domain-containing protein [Paracoccus halophilus]KGJ04212.1 hypothetical protein IT41_10955 [Paracoccus halophilus]SFA51855.1 protein of unknown function [Paracoccus halophilus]
MSTCLLAGAMAVALAPGGGFSLEWSHSVEKIRWHEEWQVTPGGLRLTRAAIQGHGAGMEPGPDARLEDGWLVWQPQLPPVPELVLAASGATGGGWRLCGADCVELGADAGRAITLKPCPP